MACLFAPPRPAPRGCSSDLGWPPAQRSPLRCCGSSARPPLSLRRHAPGYSRERGVYGVSGRFGAAGLQAMWREPRPGRGTRARDRARGRVPSRLSGLHGVASLLCPRTLTAPENAPQGGCLWSNRLAGALPGGAWQAGPHSSGEGAASGGLGGRLPL